MEQNHYGLNNNLPQHLTSPGNVKFDHGLFQYDKSTLMEVRTQDFHRQMMQLSVSSYLML